MCTLANLVKEEIAEKLSKGETLTAWRQLSEVLEWVKKAEMDLRKELVSKSFENAKKGKNEAEVEGGKLVYTRSFKTEVDETMFDQVAKECEDNFIDVGSLFKATHRLVAKEYNAYGAEEKAIIDKMLVVKEQSPKLEFVANAID